MRSMKLCLHLTRVFLGNGVFFITICCLGMPRTMKAIPNIFEREKQPKKMLKNAKKIINMIEDNVFEVYNSV